MKIIYAIIIICLFSIKANAQSKVGLKAGTNLSFLSGLINAESKTRIGPMFGVFADLAASKHIHFQPELLLSSDGAKYENYFKQTNLSLTYINVPFLVKVYIQKIVSFYAGPQYGYLLSATENIDSSKIRRTDVRESFQDHEFSMVYGIGFDVSKHFNFGARLNYGISDIRVQPSTFASNKLPELHKRGFQFNVGYSF